MAEVSGIYHYYGEGCSSSSNFTISDSIVSCNGTLSQGTIRQCTLYTPGTVYLYRSRNFSNSIETLESLNCSTILDVTYFASCTPDNNGLTYCSVIKPGCSVGNLFLDVGTSKTFFEKSLVPFDQKCKSETRTCSSDSSINGSYQYETCSVEKVIKSNQVESMGTAVTTAGSGLVHIGIQLMPYAIGFVIILILFGLIKNWGRLKTNRQLKRLHRQKTRSERREIERYRKK